MNTYNGLEKDTPNDPRIGSATMTSGTATVYITDDGTSTGNGYLQPSTTYLPFVWINNKGNSYPCEGILSNNNKTLTIGANQQGTATTNVLINLLGGLTSVLTGVTYGSVPNGTTVYYYIIGPLA